MAINRVPFLLNTSLKIAVITPESGDAYADFEKEISFILNNNRHEVVKHSVSFLSKDKLLDKINTIIVQNGFRSVTNWRMFWIENRQSPYIFNKDCFIETRCICFVYEFSSYVFWAV